MRLHQIEERIQGASPDELRLIAEALVSHIRQMRISFKVIEFETKIGLKDDIPARGPSVWPGDW